MPLPELLPDGLSCASRKDVGAKLKDVFHHRPKEAASVFSGHPIMAETVASILGAETLESLCRMSILGEARNGRLSARFRAQIVLGKIILTDHARTGFRRESLIVDPLWEGPALARLLISRPRQRSLDIGTGCGVLALALSDWSEEVVGTDINPRALLMARLNADLNGVKNVSFIQSDLFSSVRGQRFDQIVFNAPVGAEFRSRHMLEAGPGILESFFRDLDGHLSEFGVVQTNVCFRDWPNDSFMERMKSWIGPSGSSFGSVFLRLWRRSSGPSFLLDRLMGSLVIGPSALKCLAISRGILTLARSSAPRDTVIDVNYHLWPQDASIRHLGDALLTTIETGAKDDLRTALNKVG